MHITFRLIILTGGLAALWSCGPDSASRPVSESSESTSRTATYQGRSVHYVDTGGSGPALVLVHGWASDIRVWDAQIESFASRARVIAVDLPGHGRSEPPAAEFSMDLFARATAAVMDDAGVDKAVLIGHSNGTPVIRQFYRLLPERTLALIAVDGALKQTFGAELAAMMKQRLSAEEYGATIDGMIEHMRGDGLDRATRERIKQIARAQPHAAVLGGFEAALDPNIWEPDPIAVPILLALAAQPSWDEDYLAFVKELAPYAEIHLMQSVSHFLMMERPSEFHSLVMAFLDRNDLL